MKLHEKLRNYEFVKKVAFVVALAFLYIPFLLHVSFGFFVVFGLLPFAGIGLSIALYDDYRLAKNSPPGKSRDQTGEHK